MNEKIKKTLIIILWIVLWGAIAAWISSSIVFSGPIDVANKAMQMFTDNEVWASIGLSLLRIFAGFIIACILGVSIAVLSYRIKIVYDLLQPLIQFFKSAPIVCIIVLLLFWFGSKNIDLIVVIITVLPVYFFAIYEALHNRNQNIVDMFTVYKTPKKLIWHAYELPNALPYFNQATKTGIGLSWKAGITTEMIGALNLSIGMGVYNSKIALDSAQLLVWMFLVIILAWICEKIILKVISIYASSSQKNNINHIANLKTSSFNKSIKKDDIICSLNNVSKSFGKVEPVKNKNLRIKFGQKYCITGDTGSGKTTLLKIILGLCKPTSGTTEILTLNPRTYSVVLQESSLIEDLTVAQNIQLAANKNIDTSNDELILWDLKISELSGGMKRMCEIQRAILSDSYVVVLDEPFTGLDISTRKKAIKYINDNLNNRTLILITHDKKDIESLSINNII